MSFVMDSHYYFPQMTEHITFAIHFAIGVFFEENLRGA